MSIVAAMRNACATVGVQPPGRTKPGEWVRCVTFPCDAINETVQNANTPRDCGPQRVLTSPTCQEVEMALDRVCTIDGCFKPVKARGWCTSHYQRWRKHGDPLSGGKPRPAKGAVPEWLSDHINFSRDECLIWPFARDPSGYAVINVNGRKRFAHRVMCENAHGAAPSQDHYACHSCGKGHEGCVNPQHLRWGTPSENVADMVGHGTAYRGEACVAAKLTVDDVRRIRASSGSRSAHELAEAYGVSRRTIRDAIERRTWAWLA